MSKTKFRPTRTDVTAAVLFGLLFLFFAFFLNRGLNAALSDESYYFAMPYRFLQGDRMLVDEWYPTQFISFLLTPIVKAYLALKGSTDGILLFFRRLFLVFLSAVYWIIYRYLRPRGVRCLIALFVFCLSVPFTIFTFSYYAAALYVFATVCAIVFLRDKPIRAPAAVLLGGLFSVVVFNEPIVVFVWAALALLTVIRRICARRRRDFLKQYDRFLNLRFIGFTFLGGAVCGGAALISLALKSGVADLFRALPYVLADPKHPLLSGLRINHLLPVNLFGLLPFCVCILFLIGAVLFRALKKESAAFRTVLFAGSCLSVAGTMAYVLAQSLINPENSFLFLLSYSYLFNILGLDLYFLCRERDPKTVPFLFAGLCFGVSVDLFSEAACGFGGTLVLFYLADALPQTLREIRAAGEKKAAPTTTRKFLRVCSGGTAVILLAAVFCWQTRYCSLFASPQFEKKITQAAASADVGTDVLLTRGPLKGLYTSEYVGSRYNAALDDLDRISSTCDGTLYIPALAPYLYLYSELRCGTLAVFFEGDYVYERQREYWTLLPEKRPDAIYLPNDWGTLQAKQNDVLDFIRSVCRFRSEKLGAGYLFRVTEWLI